MTTRSPGAIREHALPDPTSPHETALNAVLRPIVFGANDGLVSNLALVMGVGATGVSSQFVLFSGIAGLLAGALSMGAGEFVSVRSQRELLDYQIAFQRKQLREVPEQERRILERLYLDRGFTPEQATAFVDAVFEDGDHATRQLIFEEVGLDERSIGSPLSAAVGSFAAFTAGAFVPLLPFLLTSGATALVASLALSFIALALLGLGISRLTRRSPLMSAVRQVALGGVAAAVTYAVGSLIGVQIA